ncbi:MAG: metallophosphoesterase [Oscillospiraceae bacterium]|nr:metallophosphoesterase [Oscillospiraceae bacterium]
MSIRRRKKRKARRFVIALLIIAALLALAFRDSAENIDSAEYSFAFSSLPASFDGLRIVQISDLHAKEFGSGNSRLLKKTAAARPDIIAVTGDIIDDKGQLDMARTLFSGLAAIAPVYYVAGNHEWSSGELPALRKVLSECGVRSLSNSYDVLYRGEDKIVIAGLEDPNGYADMLTPSEFMARLQAREGECFTVLLSHRNNTPEYYLPLGAELVLSGHAHGGIIRLPFTDGLINASREFFPSYTNGPYRLEDMVLFVSRGLGNSVKVPRLFNRPHMPIITLRAQAAS